MESEYKVKLEIFEGPLDLLLFLIKRDEIDIYDISLERITRQYLEYLEAFKELNIDLACEFVVMAANLIYLKSRSLLPVDQQPPEEDAEEDDPRWELIRQLIEYKKFKEAAAQLHVRELEQERMFTRDGGSVAAQAPTPSPLDPAILTTATSGRIARIAASTSGGERSARERTTTSASSICFRKRYRTSSGKLSISATRQGSTTTDSGARRSFPPMRSASGERTVATRSVQLPTASAMATVAPAAWAESSASSSSP